VGGFLIRGDILKSNTPDLIQRNQTTGGLLLEIAVFTGKSQRIHTSDVWGNIRTNLENPCAQLNSDDIIRGSNYLRKSWSPQSNRINTVVDTLGVSQIPSMSNFRKVDPKQISGYKVDPKKWIPKKLVVQSGSQKVDPNKIRECHKWIPRSGSQHSSNMFKKWIPKSGSHGKWIPESGSHDKWIPESWSQKQQVDPTKQPLIPLVFHTIECLRVIFYVPPFKSGTLLCYVTRTVFTLLCVALVLT